jgi:hypothetical protein
MATQVESVRKTRPVYDLLLQVCESELPGWNVSTGKESGLPINQRVGISFTAKPADITKMEKRGLTVHPSNLASNNHLYVHQGQYVGDAEKVKAAYDSARPGEFPELSIGMMPFPGAPTPKPPEKPKESK